MCSWAHLFTNKLDSSLSFFYQKLTVSANIEVAFDETIKCNEKWNASLTPQTWRHFHSNGQQKHLHDIPEHEP